MPKAAPLPVPNIKVDTCSALGVPRPSLCRTSAQRTAASVMALTRRPLHYVFKVGDRAQTAHFYRSVLGMTFLRHEEFEAGCEATCNGPYDGKWSKSMVGYGPEDAHFVVELTYNYGVGAYAMGNDFKCITIHSPEVFARAAAAGEHIVEKAADGTAVAVRSPDGHVFRVVNAPAAGADPVAAVSLAVTDLAAAKAFWVGVLGMEEGGGGALRYPGSPWQLELTPLPEGTQIDRAKAFGRTAFSCPAADLPGIQAAVEAAGAGRVQTPLLSLDTPGKAQVQVVIVADPDGHEICFVGDEGFRELSVVDPKADALLDAAMAADKSDEWFAKEGKAKQRDE